jgi:HAD superfamily phosphoserine phosphatase-like hydrolase
MELLESFTGSFIRDCVLPNLYFPAFQELRRAQHCGAYTVIMSSSPSFLVRRVAEALNVDEWIATEYHLDSSHRLMEVEQFIDGKAKGHALGALAEKRGVPLERIAAYSDSYRDLPFLRLVGRPVAVNPDPKLYEFCLENQWQII